MDNHIIYAESEQRLNKLIEVVTEFSRCIEMEFGLDKCTKCIIRKGTKVRSEYIQIGEDSFNKDLEEDNTYLYLGIEEKATIK